MLHVAAAAAAALHSQAISHHRCYRPRGLGVSPGSTASGSGSALPASPCCGHKFWLEMEELHNLPLHDPVLRHDHTLERIQIQRQAGQTGANHPSGAGDVFPAVVVEYGLVFRSATPYRKPRTARGGEARHRP